MAFRRFSINTSESSDAIKAIAASMRGIAARMNIATTGFPKRHPPEWKRKRHTLSRVGCLMPSCVGGQPPSRVAANWMGIAARKRNATTARHNQQPPIRKRGSHTRTQIDIEKPFLVGGRRPPLSVNRPMLNGGPVICELWDVFNELTMPSCLLSNAPEFDTKPFGNMHDLEDIVDGIACNWSCHQRKDGW